MSETLSYEFRPIGFIKSCFKEKFGVPRQSLLVREATAVLKLRPDFDAPSLLRGLETFSHLWVIYIFHKNIEQGWSPTVEPPRESLAERVGVLASRSPHRPNPIGLSAVKLERVDLSAAGGAEIHLSGVDILDETPVVDIKPYVPYADSISDASAGWASEPIPRYPVAFSALALEKIRGPFASQHPRLEILLREILELDPRPTPQKKGLPLNDRKFEGEKFAFRFFNFDVKWQIRNGGIWVLDLLRL